MFNSLLKFYYTSFSKNADFYQPLFRILGYCPSRLKLYRQAFVHNSISNSSDQTTYNNERLEYLGDAVLDLVIADLLYKKFPFQGEGFLTEMRSKSVSRKRLSQIATDMGIQEMLNFDKSIKRNHAAVRSLAGNALEALIGAIYLDKGYVFTLRFIRKKVLGVHLDFDELKETTENFKSLLNQYAQRTKKELVFEVQNKEEDSKIKIYIIAVKIDGEEIARARGKSKKIAEQLASEKACDILKLLKN